VGGNPKYDLEERTAKFGEAIIDFARTTPKTPITTILITQLVRSATSIGANYCEADDAESANDFKHKIGICKKESRETKHWLRMMVKTCPELKNLATNLWIEAKELNLIFNAIIRSANKNNRIRN
jgi:four helix bundle protein